MASPVWTTPTIPSNYDNDFNKRYFTSLIKYLQGSNLLYRRMGTAINTKRPNWKGTITTLLGDWGEVAEGIQEAPPLRPAPVTKMEARVKLVKGILAVSREQLEDDEATGMNYVNALIPKFAERGVRRLEQDFTNTFINNAYTYDPLRDLRDSTSLINVSHTAGASGIVYGNRPAVSTALSESALQNAISYYYVGIYDDAGDLVPMLDQKDFTLYVHPSRYLFARQLVKSTGSTADYKNSGVLNSIGSDNGINITVVPVPYQISTTQWTLTPDNLAEDDAGLIVLMRVAPSAPERITRQNPDQSQWQGRMRYGLFAANPRPIYGSQG